MTMAEDRATERLRVALVKAFPAAKAKRSRPPRRTATQAMNLLGVARRPVRPRAVAAAGDATILRLWGEVGWDSTARDLIDQLEGAGAVELHVNSPGGEVWEAIAMYNALKDHRGEVVAVVDGMAASAASFIVMAADRVTMNRASKMMVHDAMTGTFGHENDHLQTAELLGKVSDTIAGIYAVRAGGTAAEWRDVMRDTKWYSAAEAVEAGLADEAVEDVPAASIDARAFRAAVRAALL